MNLQEDYENAVNKVRDIFVDLDENDQLIFYSLFKQSTIGDCILERSEFILDDDVRKWEAWSSHKGMPKDVAMQTFIQKFFELQRRVKK